MKLTVDGCIERGILGRVKVFLNGNQVKKCVMADDEKGIVEVAETENIIDDCISTYFMHGKVRIDVND